MYERILCDLLLEWLEGWPAYRSLKNNDHNERQYQLVTDIIPNSLENFLLYELGWNATGSAGKGAIAWAPTVSVKTHKRDKVSSVLQLTYFISLDTERIYLSIGLGMLGGRKGSLNSKITQTQMNDLRDRADQIFFSNTEAISHIYEGPLQEGLIDLSADLARGSKIPKAYEYSNIVAKCYIKSEIPNDVELLADLETFIEIFENIGSSETVQDLSQEDEIVNVECPGCGEIIRVTIEMLRS